MQELVLESIDTKHLIKSRETLYRLIISQLFYDGYQTAAVRLSQELQVEPPCAPSDRLLHIMLAGIENEPDRKKRPKTYGIGDSTIGPGLDLEFETELAIPAPEPALYETVYVTSHKGPCRSGCFSPDGTLVATGSEDASIKILDVERMIAKSTPDEAEANREVHGHPVIRTLYDHIDEVTCLEFHPREQILVSGSRDCTIKIFDISKPATKKAYRTISEVDEICSIAFHPAGDHILVGTNQNVLRLYDVNTSQCFVGRIPSQEHKGPINFIKYSLDGKLYASASKDGQIKLWDAVTCTCINVFERPHDGLEVCSVTFSKNGKYLLSSGKDSLVKLWELTTNRCLIAYTGAGTTGRQEHVAQAIFNHTEDYVLFPDEATQSLCTWDSRNASRKQLLSLGHNGPIQLLHHSPTHAAFISCSDDYRARFWYRRTAAI